MPKITVEIKWDNPLNDDWLDTDDIWYILQNHHKKTKFKVKEIKKIKTTNVKLEPPSSLDQLEYISAEPFFNPNKKVYCKDCKFRKSWDISYFFCSRKYTRLIEWYDHIYTGEISREDRSNNESVSFNKNDDGKCKYYKRKWWKFWR